MKCLCAYKRTAVCAPTKTDRSWRPYGINNSCSGWRKAVVNRRLELAFTLDNIPNGRPARGYLRRSTSRGVLRIGMPAGKRLPAQVNFTTYPENWDACWQEYLRSSTSRAALKIGMPAEPAIHRHWKEWCTDNWHQERERERERGKKGGGGGGEKTLLNLAA